MKDWLLISIISIKSTVQYVRNWMGGLLLISILSIKSMLGIEWESVFMCGGPEIQLQMDVMLWGIKSTFTDTIFLRKSNIKIQFRRF